MRKRHAVITALLVLSCTPDDIVKKVPNNWFNTMSNSPAPRPYAQNRAPVEGTVPVTGRAITTVGPETANGLRNPRSRTAESLNRGEWFYQVYCAVCHGVDARGGPGYPDLTDASWLWGGDPEVVAETLRVGINSGHEEREPAR